MCVNLLQFRNVNLFESYLATILIVCISNGITIDKTKLSISHYLYCLNNTFFKYDWIPLWLAMISKWHTKMKINDNKLN